MKHKMKTSIATVARSVGAMALLVVLAPMAAEARPEYALTNATPTCLACHISPFGGGARTVDGKYYGSRFGKTASPLSEQNWVSADLRSITYYPVAEPKGRHGTALMAANVIGHAPILKGEDGGAELHAVAGYNFGRLTGRGNQREMYVLWQSSATENRPVVAQFGRFNAPFGLMTDEHRTFTKLLTKTEIFDYEYGASFSGEFFTTLHYDVAATTGLQAGGDFVEDSTDNPVAGYLNLRWMPPRLPFMLGASVGYQDRSIEYKDPYAVAGYVGISADRLTGNFVSGSILSEVVYAENWANDKINKNIPAYFAGADTLFLDAIREKPALAVYTMVNWNVFRSWQIQYKLDSLTFDPKYTGDRFLRHGLGVKKYIGSNIIANARYEIADVGRDDLKKAGTYASSDAVWLLLQLWL